VFTKAGVRPNVVVETSTAASAIAHVVGLERVSHWSNAFSARLAAEPGHHLQSRSSRPWCTTPPSSQRRTKVLSSVAQRFIEYARSTLPPSDDMSQTL